MTDIRTQICDADGCRKARLNDSNHWLVAWRKNHVLHVSLMDNSERPEVDDMSHFCGEQCAARWFINELGSLAD